LNIRISVASSSADGAPENIEYYVNIFVDNNKHFKKDYPKLNEIIDTYQIHGRGDPRLGLPMISKESCGDYAVTFTEEDEALRFMGDIIKLDYIKELNIGKIVYQYK
jgi:hypothetical protein